MEHRAKLAWGIAVCLIWPAACATDTTPTKAEPIDASVDTVVDSPLDGAQDVLEESPDSSAVTSGIGRACAADRSCEKGDICINASKQVDMPGGYCSRQCETAADCEQPSVCTDFLGYAMCMLTCTSDSDCRTGYACEDKFVMSPAPKGTRLCVPGRRLAQVGGSCSSLFDCTPGNGICIVDLLDGYCTEFCDPKVANACGTTARCVQSSPEGDDGLCFESCEKDSDCRNGNGYQCTSEKLCSPGSRSAMIGQACEHDNECLPEFGTCLRQMDTGIPGGYCSQLCDVQSENNCGPDAECVTLRSDLSLCVLHCPDMGECRDGFHCASAFMGIATKAAVCAPGQSTDTPIGHDCASASDCKLGEQACLTPSLSRSFKGGYCTAACDPTYPDALCPSGSLCVSDVMPGIGACVAQCTTDQECQARRSPTSTADYGCSIRLGTGVRVPNGKMACVAYKPLARIGDSCIDGSDCASGLGRCIFDNSPAGFPRFPNGYCTVDCNPNAQDNTCGADAVCHNIKKGTSLGGSCLKACATDGDCRQYEGYTCQLASTGAKGCLPKP